MTTFQKNSAIGFISLMLVGFIVLGYFVPRTNFPVLISIYTSLFIGYYVTVFKLNKNELFKFFLIAAFTIRFCLIFSTPALSDDYFRFFWDGKLMHLGINPYTHLPSDLIHRFENVDGMKSLYEGMNSKNYFSVYPPLAQLSYYIASFFLGEGVWGAIICYKLLIFLAELATVPVMIRLLKSLNKEKGMIFIYLLNPLMILEFSGNLHGEVFVILGLLVSSSLLLEKRYILSAIILGFTISFKLLPLIFLPFILRYIGFKKGMLFSAIAIAVLIFTFIPFVDKTFIKHIFESLGHYFNLFEFNSSIPNAARQIIKWLTKENHTAFIGKICGLIAFVLLLIYSLKSNESHRQNIFNRFSTLLFIYLIFAMSIHPWYIAPLIAFAVFTSMRFSVIWSWAIFLTYITYEVFPYQQNRYLIAIEYILVLGTIVYEYFRENQITTT